VLDGEEELFFEVDGDLIGGEKAVLDASFNVLISVLLVLSVVVDNGKDGDTCAVHHGDDGVVGGGFDGLDVFREAIFHEEFHFAFENVLVVKAEEFFVGEVDAELFEAVVFEVLKSEDIENVDGS